MGKINLNYLVETKSNEAIKGQWGCIKRTQEPACRGSQWPKMRHGEIRGNRLQFTKMYLIYKKS